MTRATRIKGPDDVATWLQRTWDPELTLRDWWRLLAEASAIRTAIADAGLPGPPAGLGIMMAGPTILAHGTDEQKAQTVL